MSRASRLTCTAAATIAAVAGPGHLAAARNVFAFQTDNWFVSSLTNSCIAVNRPPNEYNQSPYNSLTIHAPKDGGFLIEVVFWPGVVENGKPYRLTLRVEGGDVHEIDVDGIGDMALKSRGPIADGLVKELQAAPMFSVRPSGKQTSLTFDTTRIDDVFTYLDSCRRLIAQE